MVFQIILAQSVGLSGDRLVLESDGTEIEDSDILVHCAGETLLILGEGEIWASNSSISPANKVTEWLLDMPIGSPPKIHTNSTCENVSLSTTMTMSSGALSSDGPYATETIKSTFFNFEIPWDKMPCYITSILTEKKRIGIQINDFVHIVVNELRQISFYIPMAVFRNVAGKIACRYPESFGHTDENGEIVNSTLIYLVTKMVNHNNYLNRSKTSTLSPTIPLKKRRITNILQKSCRNWQPEILPESENQNSLDTKREWLKNIWGKELTEHEKRRAEEYMDTCFAIIRSFLNEQNPTPTITTIKAEWPYLCEKQFVFAHFNKLMERSVQEFSKNYAENWNKILAFGKSLKRRKIIEFFAKNLSENEDILTIRFICLYFDEPEENIFRKFEVN